MGRDETGEIRESVKDASVLKNEKRGGLGFKMSSKMRNRGNRRRR